MFSPWIRWIDRATLPNIQSPGVYAIAVSSRDIHGENFSWHEQIAYIGHSDGIIKRLRTFDAVLLMKQDKHSGAKKMRQKYTDYDALVEKLYVAIAPIGQGRVIKSADCWRRIGDARKLECDCFASFHEKYQRMPEFNS